jgi:hypothetical protein
MLKFLRALVQPAPAEPAAAPAAAPGQVAAPGVPAFDVLGALTDAEGLPVLDWQAAQAWVAGIADASQQREAWGACEKAWLAHLRAALGPAYRLQGKGSALLLSTLSPAVAEATLAFVNKTVQRILRALHGIAAAPAWGHDILIVFDDAQTYYCYVSHYYPEAGEFAASSGMYLQGGCGHFVTVKADLHAVEPVIAHELTHACLSHLPIPAWLNEGLAVNTEHRLSPRPGALPDPRAMHARHQAFWGETEIQQFWSGQSFLRNDEANELSYDLARILVAQFAADWERFSRFALSADLQDGGAAAARQHLQIDLGAAACALLGHDPDAAWSPRPYEWQKAPEKGAF